MVQAGAYPVELLPLVQQEVKKMEIPWKDVEKMKRDDFWFRVYDDMDYATKWNVGTTFNTMNEEGSTPMSYLDIYFAYQSKADQVGTSMPINQMHKEMMKNNNFKNLNSEPSYRQYRTLYELVKKVPEVKDILAEGAQKLGVECGFTSTISRDPCFRELLLNEDTRQQGLKTLRKICMNEIKVI